MNFKKIGIIGSGIVGQTLASGFLKSGYEIKVGTRDKSKLNEWVKKAGNKASVGSFQEAAKFADLIVFCVKGTAYEEAINMAGKNNFDNKIVIDVTNPLLFEEKGVKLAVGYPNSFGANIQKLLPKSKVVKAFNTIPAHFMCNPKLEEGIPDLFIAGNDKNAKKEVIKIAKSWGWASVIDAGNIEQAYLLEALAMLLIDYGIKNNYWMLAWKLLKK